MVTSLLRSRPPNVWIGIWQLTRKSPSNLGEQLLSAILKPRTHYSRKKHEYYTRPETSNMQQRR